MTRDRHTACFRCATALLIVWYGGVATDLACFALDRLAPLSKTVAHPDFPCAGHDCGCKTAEQCRTQCCCFPGKPAPPPRAPRAQHGNQGTPDTVRVTHLSALRCSGQAPHDDGGAFKKIDVHIPCTTGRATALHDDEATILIAQAKPASVFTDPPDKVPIDGPPSIRS